jgi:hypothetical protein
MKTVPVLFVGRNPQDVPGYARGTAGYLPGGATSTGGSAPARRPMGGSQCHPASIALLDKSYREESNRCKEAGGAQDNLSDEKEDNEDINEDKDNNRDNKASNAELVAVAAEEQTQRQRNVQQCVASSIAIGQTLAHLGQ